MKTMICTVYEPSITGIYDSVLLHALVNCSWAGKLKHGSTAPNPPNVEPPLLDLRRFILFWPQIVSTPNLVAECCCGDWL